MFYFSKFKYIELVPLFSKEVLNYLRNQFYSSMCTINRPILYPIKTS